MSVFFLLPTLNSSCATGKPRTMNYTTTISQMLFVLCALLQPVAQAEEQVAAQVDPATDFFETHPNEIDLEQRGDSLLFANRKIGLQFKQSASGFQLARVYGIDRQQDFLTEGADGQFRNLFEIRMALDPRARQIDERGSSKYGHFVILEQMAGEDSFIIGSNEAKEVSWRREDNGPESVLHLEWKKIDARQDKGVMDVEVTVTLRAGDPLSYWRINVLNRSIYGTGKRHYPRLTKYGIERVRFPLLSLAPIEDAEDNVFLYPRYRGELFQQPFQDGHNSENFYPHNFNMQFQALYNQQSKSGFYLGTRDPAASFMVIDIRHRDSHIRWHASHFPPNMTFAGQDFDLPYDCVIGPFEGDWYDACQIYRQWAIEQFWCSKGKLSTRGDIPAWYKETPLYFYTVLGDSAEGTHSLDENLLIAEQHFREFLEWAGVPLPANFYEVWDAPAGLTAYDMPLSVYRRPRPGRWAGFSTENSGGGNYPEIPALAGLPATCARLRKAGGMVCPYFGLELFDPGPTFNAPYAAEAMPHLVRDLYGRTRRWGVEASMQPCVVTPWWRNRVKETCVLMLERENVGGFYLDTMQGCSLPCYWTPHGHTAAGGDSMTRGMHELVKIVTEAVKAKDPEAITTGENPSENMIDVTDGFLQTTLSPRNTAPIFAAVYQDYILRYGLELSAGERFFVECASLFTEGMQVGRFRLKPRNSTISFENPKDQGKLAFLKLIVDYYKQETTKNFLSYGQLMRPLTFSAPNPMPMLAYTRRHGTTGEEQPPSGGFPALMSGVFRGENGDLGIFIVNASANPMPFSSTVALDYYGMGTDSTVDVDRVTSAGNVTSVFRNVKTPVELAGSLSGRSIIMHHLHGAQ